MKIEAHNQDLPFATLYGLGLHSYNNQSSNQAALQLNGNDASASLDKTVPASTVAPAEAAGAVRQNQNQHQTTDYSQEAKQALYQMKARDREVRAHEAAHKSAAGSLAHGAAQFSYETGPDGKRYAVGGEVSIDTSEISGNPQATIVKAQIIRRAAMAPAQPSSQDRSVAAQATQMEASARQEIAQSNQNEKNTQNVGSELESIVTSIIPTPIGELFNSSV